jgi:hypothetical protein
LVSKVFRRKVKKTRKKINVSVVIVWKKQNKKAVNILTNKPVLIWWVEEEA